MKLAGIGLPLMLIIPFIIHTRNVAYQMTGTRQFSLFTGWRLANNALYMYEYSDTTKNLSETGKELDKLSIWFYGIVPKDFRDDYLLTNPGNFFIQHPLSPLKLYTRSHYAINDDYSSVIAWGKASPIFEEFGKYLIKNNPTAYFHAFMIPNTRNYFLPHLEKLEIYNLGQDAVDSIAKDWFHYKSTKVVVASKKAQGVILYIFPYLFLILNFYLFTYLIVLWLWEKYKLLSPESMRLLLVAGGLLIANFLFCVSATIIVFRYQFFPMLISLPLTLLLREWLKQQRTLGEKASGKTTNNNVLSLEKGSPLYNIKY